MERARATWTDERLDDLSRRVDSGFEHVDDDLRELRAAIDAQGTMLNARIDAQGAELGARIDAQGATLGARIDAQGAELGARIDVQGAEHSRRLGALEGRIDGLQRTMLQVGSGMSVAILATLVSVILTRA